MIQNGCVKDIERVAPTQDGGKRKVLLMRQSGGSLAPMRFQLRQTMGRVVAMSTIWP